MKMKRIISIILMLCMVLTALPVGAFASEGGEDVGYIGAPGIDSLAIVGINIPGVAEWNPSDPAGDMELVADYVYQKKLTLAAGTTMAFKIAGNDIWDDTCNFGSASIVLGEKANLECSGGTPINFTVKNDMTIQITVDLTDFVNGGNATILVEEVSCKDWGAHLG